MKIFKMTLLLIVAAVLVGLGSARAQRSDPERPPLVMIFGEGFFGGNLETWTGESSTILSEGGYFRAALSPDGTMVAYLSVAQVYLDAVAERGGFSGPMVFDVWLMTLESADQRRITSQPENAVFASETEPDRAVSHSSPRWSPDGTMIAWSVYDFRDDTVYLGLYDVPSATYRVLPFDIPPFYGIPSPVEIFWGRAGIVVLSTYVEDGLIHEDVRLFDRDGNRIVTTALEPAYNGDNLYTNLLIQHKGRDYVGRFSSNIPSTWVLTDILTGELFISSDWPMWTNSNTGAAGYRVVPTGVRPYERQLGGQAREHFVVNILDPTGAVLASDIAVRNLAWDMSHVFAIAPDGGALAYRAYDTNGRVYQDDILMLNTEKTLSVGEGRFFESMSWGVGRWEFPAETELAIFTGLG